MKYHYQKGITEKDKRSHGKMWLSFFTIFTVVAYGGFLLTILSLNGWPLADISSTAKAVKTTKPTNSKLFIPAINVVAEEGTIKLKGDPSYMDVTVSGPSIGFALTPGSLRQSSPFFNIGQLRVGDEIFLDSDGTRYVYEVTKKVGEDEQKLTLQNADKKVTAKTIGMLVWRDGKPILESF